ncbi:MAG: FAD-dependent oxidoreductase, partial [Armatimonadota bacterium]|nr:FAD-dependent oxidoreductase [Armatimonadota bacterium]
VPKGIDGLLVPVAVSATHIGLSTVRMEPTWMAMGQAAGTAAYISTRLDVPIRQLSIALVQDIVLFTHQVTIFLRDVGYEHRDFAGLNYGGLIGLFPGYQAEPQKRLDRATAAAWLWHWMQHRYPGLKTPGTPPQFADVAADRPEAAGIGVLGAVGALGPVPSGASFRPDEPLSAEDAARWIARAHRVSDRWRRNASDALRSDLEERVARLLREVAAQDQGVDPQALTRGQFLRLLYLAARTATPR